MEIFGQGATSYNMPAAPPQIDVPLFQQLVPDSELKKAVQVQVQSPAPALGIISEVEVVGLKPLNIDSKLYPVPYNITGGIIQKFYADSFTKKLTIEVIGGVNGGHLQLQLSRKIMDSIQVGEDARFVVSGEPVGAANKIPLAYVETKTNAEARTLKINFPQDRSIIEITGTTIIPEFPLPQIMLIISLGLILAFCRTKLTIRK